MPVAQYPNSVTRAVKCFKAHGGILRTSEAMGEGVHVATLYKMRDEGLVEALARGVYRLVESGEMSQPDLVTVTRKIPNAVICLVSALSFHEITTRIPHAVEIMLPRSSWVPSLAYPLIEVHTTQPLLHGLGRVVHRIDDSDVPIYSPEKTLVDCVKHRNKLGTELVIEALRLYRDRKPLKVDQIMEYARASRVVKVMEPYLDGVL
jgi:predicted transcriptional regulator of viral defense system